MLLGILDKEPWARGGDDLHQHPLQRGLADPETLGNGLPADGISGHLDQRKRLSLLQRFFKDDELKILVATTRPPAARRQLRYQIRRAGRPREGYVHRVGRTARAGAVDKAITILL